MNITELEPLFKQLEAARQKRHDLISLGAVTQAGGAILEWKGKKVTFTAGDINILKNAWIKEIDRIKAEIESK